MSGNVSDCLLLFNIIDYYKKHGDDSYGRPFLADMKDSEVILSHLMAGKPTEKYDRSRKRLVNRLESLGCVIDSDMISVLSFSYDEDVLSLMKLMLNRIIYYKRWCFRGKEARFAEIQKRLMALHNLPRPLLLDVSGRYRYLSSNYISKEDALICAKGYCEADYRKFLAKKTTSR